MEIATSVINRLTYLKNTLFRYLDFFCWLLPDSFLRRKWLTLSVLATGALGVAFQIKVFALIIYYARHFSSGDAITIGTFSLDPRTSLGLLIGGSILVSLLLAVSTMFTYYSRRNILRMGRDYEEFCSKRVFSILDINTDVFSAKDKSSDANAYLLRLVRADSRFAGRVFRTLFSMVIPALTMVFALGILLYLEAFLTFIISILAIAFIYFQYRVSRQAAGHSIRFDNLSAFAAYEYKVLLQHFKMKDGSDGNRFLVDRFFDEGPIKNHMNAYEGRLQTIESSRLISGLFMAAVMGLIILIMGAGIIMEGSGWSRLIVFVVALRYAMGNLQSTFSSLTAINRFYPQVRRYFSFVQAVESQDKERYRPIEEYDLHLNRKISHTIPGSSARGKLKIGDRLAYVSSVELNRYTLAVLIKTILGDADEVVKGALYSMRFATSQPSCPYVSMRNALGLSNKNDFMSLKNMFPNRTTWETALKEFPKNLDKPINSNHWSSITPATKVCIALISIISSDCQWVFIEAKALDLLNKEPARFYLDLLGDKMVVIVHNDNFRAVGTYGESLVAVGEEDIIFGLGTPNWFENVQKSVKKNFDKKKNKRKHNSGIDNDDLDDEL